MTNRFFKSLAVAVVLTVAAISTSQNAHAGKGTRNFILGAAAGVAGLAVIDSLSHRRHYAGGYGYYNYGYGYRPYNYGYRYPRYRRPYYGSYYRSYSRPRYRTYYAPRRIHRGRPARWSRAWYRYCANKYRSFRRSDGTFQPYKGPRRICR